MIVDPDFKSVEDNVLVKEDGCEVMTKDVPKEIDEIEGLMRKR